MKQQLSYSIVIRNHPNSYFVSPKKDRYLHRQIGGEIDRYLERMMAK